MPTIDCIRIIEIKDGVNMPKNTTKKQVIIYQDNNGKEPFIEWIESLRDSVIRRRILQRIFRLQSGNYGDCKSLKEGVYELRLMFGAGYRVYFGEDGETIVVLLCGGDKSTQKKDIVQAKAYWKEYLSDE